MDELGGILTQSDGRICAHKQHYVQNQAPRRLRLLSLVPSSCLDAPSISPSSISIPSLVYSDAELIALMARETEIE